MEDGKSFEGFDREEGVARREPGGQEALALVRTTQQ